MINTSLRVLVLASVMAFAAAQTKSPPQLFCCPKVQKTNDPKPQIVNFSSASMSTKYSDTIHCVYEGGSGASCDYTLVAKDYGSFKYWAGELYRPGDLACGSEAIKAPATAKEAAAQGLACAPTFCCPASQDSLDQPAQKKNFLSTSYDTETVTDFSDTKETVLTCRYEGDIFCKYRLDGTTKTVQHSLCHNPVVRDVSSNANCAKPV